MIGLITRIGFDDFTDENSRSGLVLRLLALSSTGIRLVDLLAVDAFDGVLDDALDSAFDDAVDGTLDDALD